METTGRKRTECSRPDCTRTPHGKNHRCKECDVEWHKKSNPLRRFYYRIAGSERAYYALPSEKRKEIRTTAVMLYDLGADFGTAQNAEATELRGFVYVINHPRLIGVKVGRAYNPESRLRGYQTGCPRRAYQLRFAAYFDNCHSAEAAIHARLNEHQLEGEWFSIQPDEAQECIEAFARLNEHQLENNL